MIFQKLTLHNFGIYGGRQEIDLAPPGPDQPIILFGGLNGGGKTTFLNALLLVLYGKNSKPSNRSSTEAYETYLLRSINREIPPSEGAAIELTFNHFVDGRRETVSISRCWRATRKAVSESVEVRRDGQLDPFLADNWNEYVEELIPYRLARLFFFDGEKIESLADPASAAEFIRTGIHDLLGLDLVSTLIADLKILERKVPSSTVSESTRTALDAQERAVEDVSKRRAALIQDAATIQNAIDKLKSSEHDLKSKYRQMGGELFDRRDELQRALEKAEAEHFHVEDALREEAAGIAPLLLIRDLLEQAVQQAELEERAGEAKAVLNTLETRDTIILKKLKGWGIDKQQNDKLASFLRRDREKFSAATQVQEVIGIRPSSLSLASGPHLDDVETRVRVLLERHDHTAEAIVRIQTQVAAVPDPEGLEGVSAQLSGIEESLIKSEHEHELLTREIDSISVRIEKEQARLESLRQERVKAAFAEESSALLLESGQRCRDYLDEFRQRLSEKSVHRVSQLIFDCFLQLMRKASLISAIEIDATDYSLRLLGSRGELIQSERLSAGERQLLAISILWALARAAGRPIPTVIDTPLGRLDGIHRKHLVERYFPYAAHQVILLSTDEEIAGELYESMKPNIGREYMLRYEEETQTSLIDAGYDFRGAA